MRRKDREITDFSRILGILRKCDVCRLGINDENGAYIVPMNFGFNVEGDKLSLYFHSAKDGKKLELLQKSPIVGFELDTSHKLISAESACAFSFEYESIIGKGKLSMLSSSCEKRFALGRIMEHYTGNSEYSFSEEMLRAVCVLMLEVGEISCKANK